MTGAPEVLERSLFFEEFSAADRAALAALARPARFEGGQQIFAEGEPAEAFYLLVDGTVEMTSRLSADRGSAGPAGPGDPTAEGTMTVRTVGAPGHPLGWMGVVQPHVHQTTATAHTTTNLLVWEREVLQHYVREHPEFGVAFMRQILSLVGGRLRAARLRLVAHRYDADVVAIQSLIEQHGEHLSVTSPLHKLPHYLQSRLTMADALAVVESLVDSSDKVERLLADLISDILADVRRELRSYQRLQSIYELVARAPDDVDPVALRSQSCERFVELFSETRHVIVGLDLLPADTGHLVVTNHLVNHVDNLLPNRFTLTLDTHFISSMLLYRHYGQAPVRVIRASGPREYGHRTYYDRLGYIYVSSRVPGEESGRRVDPGEFAEQTTAALAAGTNVVVCPEGTSVPTERSPLRFRAGAFRLVAGLRPEPLIVPIAVANFDKQLTRSTTAVVVHPPFRLSDVVEDPTDTAQLHAFLNDDLHPRYVEWVREAVALAADA